MDESCKKMETPGKIVEPLITIPKPRPSAVHHQHHQQQHQQLPRSKNSVCPLPVKLVTNTSKYSELLGVIEELGQHIRPSYTGHRGSSEKIRQLITRARLLVRECLIETEKSARQ